MIFQWPHVMNQPIYFPEVPMVSGCFHRQSKMNLFWCCRKPSVKFFEPVAKFCSSVLKSFIAFHAAGQHNNPPWLSTHVCCHFFAADCTHSSFRSELFTGSLKCSWTVQHPSSWSMKLVPFKVSFHVRFQCRARNQTVMLRVNCREIGGQVVI